MEKQIIKTRLKELRAQKGLSQEQISEILGISSATYSEYELNQTLITVPILIKLANLYNTSVDYILYITNDPIPKPRTANLLEDNA